MSHSKITKEHIKEILKNHPRKQDSHKGVFGHSLIIAGSYGKIGAAVLATKAALRIGVGKVTVCIPKVGYEILQSTVPEAMVITRGEKYLEPLHLTEAYNSIGIGPGIGTRQPTRDAFGNFIKNNNPLSVLDADALNIIAQNKQLLKYINESYILTPHQGEFSKLFNVNKNDRDKQIRIQNEVAVNLGTNIILKGHSTSIAFADGSSFINSTGNVGLATAGSGDVLTGIITGLIGQGYCIKNATMFGVYIHGLAADIAIQKINVRSIVATDIIDNISNAYNLIIDK